MTLSQTFEQAIPRIETPRLILRAPGLADFDAFADYKASDRSRYTGGPVDRGVAWGNWGHAVGHWVLRGYGIFVIEDKTTGRALGTTGPYFPEGWPEPEIAWTLWDSSVEGKGIAAEAAGAGRAFAYETLGWTTAISVILEGNIRSEALAQRLGCVRDGGMTHPQFGKASIWRHPAADAQGAGMEAYA